MNFQQLLADAPKGDEGNHYSTPQIVETLNELLCSAAEILFNNSTKFKAQIATLLAVFQTDHRKHLSNASLHDTQIAIFKALVTEQFEPLKSIFMDRSFLFSATISMAKQVDYAAEIERKLLQKYSQKRERRLAEVKEYLGITISPMIISKNVNSWLEIYIKFRNDIINNFIRLAATQAEAATKNSDIYVDFEELMMNYTLAINRAVDKCDLTKGPLASYVQQWFLNAKTNADFSHEYGISYDLPSAQRSKHTKQNTWHKQSNFAPSIDDEFTDVAKTVQNIEDENALDFGNLDFDIRLLEKFRTIKTARLAFLVLRLPIILTEEEKLLLRGKNGKTPTKVVFN